MHYLSLRYWIIVLIGSVLLIILFGHVQPRSYLQIDALAIGQGDSILITTPHQRTILVDGGPGADILTELPKALGSFRSSIDLLIITHTDADHINGIIEILPRYTIKGILMSDFPNSTLGYRELQRLLAYHDIPIIRPHPGLRISMDPEVYIDILYPWNDALPEEQQNVNNASIVAQVHYGATSILLTGDAEEIVEETLLRTQYSLQSTLLKVGHHGSRTSTTKEFFHAVRPTYSLIQFGHNNSYGHPHEEVLDRLKNTHIFESSRKTVRILCTKERFCTSIEELNSPENQAIVTSLLSPIHGAFYRYSQIFGVL